MNNIGGLYRDGNGMGQDYAQAMAWYTKADAAGNISAANHIGDLYYGGQGVPRDYAQAINWYRKSAAAGDASALFNMGFMYQKRIWRCTGLCGGVVVVPQSRRCGQRDSDE